MAYERPTAAQFKQKFPAFAAVDDAVIDDAIVIAERRVDETWTEADRQPAVMLLTAHNLTLDGHGRGVDAQVARDGLGEFQTVRSGSLSVTRATGSANASVLRSTGYGRRFLDLLRLNFAGARIVRGASAEAVHPAAQDGPP